MFLTFPCIIHSIFVDDLNIEELLQYVQDQKKSSPGVKKSNAGGWQSDDQCYLSDNPLKKVIDREMEKFFADKTIFNQSFTAKMKDMWINCNKPGDYNYSHNHPGSDLSGILWLKTPPKGGNIVFESPFSFVQYKLIESYNEDFREKSNLHSWFYIEPQERLMILFPSHLNHSVSANKSDEERISVAFNISFS